MAHHLVGVSEIAAMLGISRQRVHQLIEQAPDFPAPEAELSAGKVWARAAVDAWRAAHPERLVDGSEARPLMYNFSEASRRCVGRAQDEARRLGHTWLGTEHLLLALLSADASDVRDAFGTLGIDREAVDEKVRAQDMPSVARVDGPVPFTSRALTALQGAVARARAAGSAVAEPRHLAVSVIADHGGLAAITGAQLSGRAPGQLDSALALALDTAGPPMPLESARPQEDEARPVRCSFCRKSQTEVLKVIAGPGVYICNECVGLCDQILAAELPDPSAPLDRDAVKRRLDLIAGEVQALRRVLVD